MSNETGFFIQRATDKKLREVFGELYRDYQEKISYITYRLATGDTFSFGSTPPNNTLNNVLTDEVLLALEENNSFIINEISFSFQQLQIQYKCGETGTTPSPLFDFIGFTRSNSSRNLKELSQMEKLNISRFLQEKLAPVSPAKLLSTNLPKEYEALLSQHSAMLNKLEDLNSELLQKSHDRIKELDDRFDEKYQSLTVDFESKTTELNAKTDDEREKLETEYSQKNEELVTKIQDLEKRESQLDDRNNTHVRREIRDKMLGDVKARIENFGVSEATSSKRKPVRYAMLFLNIAVAGLLIFSLLSLHNQNGVELYWIWGRISFLSAVLIATILYYNACLN